MLTVGMQIAERAKKYPDAVLTNLHHFIDEAMLQESFDALNKRGASGVDGETWQDYNEQRGERIPRLLTAFKSGQYRAPHIRRVYIPKGDGKQRPLGLPTVEDKILQTAVNTVLTPIYEQVFYETSYGFRPGKSQHQALGRLFDEVSFGGKRYIIDADMQNYFGSIQHQHLREFLSRRIRDKVTERILGKWLKAGIMEEGQVTYPKEGTPQGGSISPLLSNVYLHYALDEWFHEQVRPLLRGSGTLIRFADDFLLLFNNKEDAIRVLKVLPKRLGKFGLTLHPEKTRLIDLEDGKGGGPRVFDFLGFTHYMGKSRKGRTILKRKTSSKKLRMGLKRMEEWIKLNRHRPVKEIIALINPKLRGHFAYYGINFNSKRLETFYLGVKRMLFKWLNRRGGKRVWSWEDFAKLITVWFPLEKPRIYHSYLLAKP
jgi:group II intron reverse transcriptase/maturase